MVLSDCIDSTSVSFRSFFTRLVDRGIDCLFLLPVVLVPIAFSPLNTNTIVIKETILQFSVIWMIAALPLFELFHRRTSSQEQPGQWLNSITLVLILISIYLAASTQWISSHPRSLHEGLRWQSYILLAFLSFLYALHAQRFYRYLFFTILTAEAISLYAIGQAFEIDFFYKDWSKFSFGVEGVRRVCGTLGNPDYLGGYLVALIPLTGILALAYTGIWRVVLFFILALEFLALIFTYSRGAEAALFITIVILIAVLMLLCWKNPQLIQSVFSRKQVVAMIAIGILAGTVIGIGMWDDISVSFRRITQFGEDTSTVTRPMYWSGALAMWKSHPLTGLGIGTFPLFFPEYRPKSLAVYQPFKEFYVEHAHNEFLEILAEMGLIGFVLYGSFLILLTVLIGRALLHTRNREDLCLLGLWGGILGILIHNMFTVTLRFTPSAFIFWSFSGVAIGRSLSIVPGGKCISVGKRIAVYCILFAAIPYVGGNAVRNFVGDYQIRQAKVWISELNPDESMKYNRDRLEKILMALYKSFELVPDAVANHFLLGLAYHKVFDYPQAVAAFERLESLQKDFTSTRLNLGISYMKQADMLGGQSGIPKITQPFPSLVTDCLTQAAVWLQRALESDPQSPDYHQFLGRTYYHLGNLPEAEKEFLDALRFSQQRSFEYRESVDSNPDIYSYLGKAYYYQGKFTESEQSFQKALQELQKKPDENPSFTRSLLAEIQKYRLEIQKKLGTP